MRSCWRFGAGASSFPGIPDACLCEGAESTCFNEFFRRASVTDGSRSATVSFRDDASPYSVGLFCSCAAPAFRAGLLVASVSIELTKSCNFERPCSFPASSSSEPESSSSLDSSSSSSSSSSSDPNSSPSPSAAAFLAFAAASLASSSSAAVFISQAVARSTASSPKSSSSSSSLSSPSSSSIS